MSVEVTVLALAALLHVVSAALMAVSANLQLSQRKTLGTRENLQLSELSGKTGRLYRAFDNSVENLMFFGVAVVVVTLGAQATGFTAICAWMFLGARVLYIPAYAFGWVPWRSLFWLVGFGATTCMIVAALV